MKNLWFIILLHLFFLLTAHAQKEGDARGILITGNVYNIETLDSLPFSHIVINRKIHLVADSNACFKVRVFRMDTLRISAIGFYDSEIILSDLVKGNDSLHLDVLMKVKAYDLGEVTLYPTYSDFKQAVLNQTITTKELHNARKNTETMKAQIKNGYNPSVYSDSDYEHLSSFRSFDNHSVILFSTNSHRGLIPTLKRLFGRN